MSFNQQDYLFLDRLSTLPNFIIKETIPDLIKGIVQTALFTPLSIVTLGLNKNINANAGKTFEENGLAQVTPKLLNRILWTFDKKKKEDDKFCSTDLYTDLFPENYADLQVNYKNFVVKHVFSRFKALGHLIFKVVLKVIFLVPGTFALIAMIATRGQYKQINQCAIKWFNPLAIISDVCQGVRAIINPFQFQPPSQNSNNNNNNDYYYPSNDYHSAN